MKLITVKEFGFGLLNNTIDLTIMIPTDSYLKTFFFLASKDINEDVVDVMTSTYTDFSGEEKDKRGYKDAENSNKFDEFFVACEDANGDPITETIDGKSYSLYKINHEAGLDEGIHTLGIGNTPGIDSKDLNLIYMKLAFSNSGTEAYYTSDATSCEDVCLVFPLYDALLLKLRTLKWAKSKNPCGNPCDYPRDFIDKILQIRAIELFLAAGDYYRAATYWRKFFNKEFFRVPKKCGCYGGVL